MERAPLCPQCGGLWTNPVAPQCRFCGWFTGTHLAPYRPAPLAYQAGAQTSFFWLRVAVIAIAAALSVVGACVSALTAE